MSGKAALGIALTYYAAFALPRILIHNDRFYFYLYRKAYCYGQRVG